MKFKEFGHKNAETIMLLHGGGLSWWNYRDVSEQLQQEYHVILPILDGHAGSDRAFTSIEDNASEITSFIDGEMGGSVLLLGGLSLGAQIVLEMLSQQKDICRYAVVESASVIPSKLTNALITPAFGSSYCLIKNRSFAKLQFRSLHMKPSLFEDYYRDTCKVARADMIAFLKANTSYEIKQNLRSNQTEIRIIVGSRENKNMLKSAGFLHRMLQNSVLEIKDGLFHGEYSISHPEQFAAELKGMIK